MIFSGHKYDVKFMLKVECDHQIFYCLLAIYFKFISYDFELQN